MGAAGHGRLVGSNQIHSAVNPVDDIPCIASNAHGGPLTVEQNLDIGVASSLFRFDVCGKGELARRVDDGEDGAGGPAETVL